MKIIIEHEVDASTFAELQEIARESEMRDIDLSGVSLKIYRGDFTCVETEAGENEAEAARVLFAVQSVIARERELPAGVGLTFLNCLYNKKN